MSDIAPRLLLDAGRYSLAATRIGGIGLRIAEFADTLSTSFDVRIAVADPDDAIPVGAAEIVPHDDWAAALGEADAVMFFDMPDARRLDEAAAARKLIVTENAVPIEQLDYPSLRNSAEPAALHAGLVAGYRRQLELSHHFLCRSTVERATLVANLCLLGRISPRDVERSRTLDHLISLVPIGFSERSLRDARRAPAETVADVLWTGGVWSFYDPVVVVEGVAACHRDGVPITLAFLHAAPEADNADLLRTARSRAAELGITDAVSFRTRPLRHQDRDAMLRGARSLVSVARPGIENETCVRLRARDSRLHGIPVIVDGHGATAAELAADDLARVLPANTAEAVAGALRQEMTRAPARRPAAELARYRYDYTMVRFATWLHTALR